MPEIILCERTESASEIVYLAAIPDAPHDDQRQRIIIPRAAVANRREGYGLDSDEAAIRAILKEHMTRILQLPADASANPKLARMGGLRNDVTIRQGTPADLPAPPPRQPAPKERLAAAVETATTFDELKAAIIAAFAAGS